MTRNELAVRAAKGAAEIHLKYFRKPLDASNKNPRDIVTVADTEAEAQILELIRSHYPDDSIVAEESGATDRQSDYEWIIDPLDGTSNFFKGSSDFCVLVAIMHKSDIVFSVTWFPVTEELYVAEKGHGATLNGEPVHVSSVARLADSYGNTHMSSKLDARKANLGIYEKLLFEARNLHVINACIARLLCDVAAGRAEFHFRVGLNIWDYAAGALLVEEAGGKVTDLQGDDLSKASKGALITNGLCHDELLTLVRTNAD